MFQFPYAYDLFGYGYRIYHSAKAPANAAVKHERFTDQISAQQFLQGLQVVDGFWEAVLERFDETPHYATDEPLIARAAGLLAAGTLSVAMVPGLKHLSSLSRNARFTKGAGATWQFLPPAALDDAGPRPLNFADLGHARAFVQQLAPDANQLKAMKELSGGRYWNPAQPVTSIAQELQAGNLVVQEQHRAASPTAGRRSPADDGPGDPLTDPYVNAAAQAPHSLGPDNDPSDEQDEPEETPVCELEKMTLRCGHFGTRGYMLDALNAEPNLNGNQKVIQVLSQRDKDADEINLAFGGFCGEGKATCPAVTIKGDGIDETVTESPQKFTVYPPERDVEVNSFTDFLKDRLLLDTNGIDYNTYEINSSGCASIEQCNAKVHVFPTCKWSGAVKMGYCYNGDNDKAEDENRKKWALEANIKGNYGTKRWELSAGDAEQTDDFFPSLRDTLTTVAEKIEELIDYHGLDEKGNRVKPRLVKPEITWPVVALSGDIGLEEVRSRHNIDVGGRVALSMDPLIEAGLTLDLVGWALNTLPGYGQFLQEIRARAARGVGTEKANVGAVIEINLTLKGALRGDLAWEKPAGRPWQCSSSGQAKLTAALKAKVEGKARVFLVKVRVGLAASLKSTSSEAEGVGAIFNLKAEVAEGKPALGGYVQFTGAAIYYTYYAEVARDGAASDDASGPAGPRRGGRKKEDDSGSSYKKSEMKKLVNILPEARFPKDPGRYTLDKVDF